MKIISLFLITVFILSKPNCNGQIANDSVTYWVNVNYLSCLDSGKSVCYCEKQNNYLIMDLDTSTKILTTIPSIYFSWETFEFRFKLDKQDTISIIPSFGIDSCSFLNIKGRELSLTSKKQKIIFRKLKFKRIEDWIQGDLRRQIGIINCLPLLKYLVVSCNRSSNLVLTKDELSKYINNGQIMIGCSDDYHYNEMHIGNCEANFYLDYNLNTIKLYKNDYRSRFEVIKVDKFKGCQLYYK